MSSSASLGPRSNIHQLVIDYAGQSADAAAFAAAVAHVYDQLAQELIPLIGELGVNALADRSVHLIEPEFPWLTVTPGSPHDISPLAQLRLDLEGQPPDVALAAAVALLATFSELLSMFVGPPLTTRLLSQAWKGGLTDSDRERNA